MWRGAGTRESSAVCHEHTISHFVFSHTLRFTGPAVCCVAVCCTAVCCTAMRCIAMYCLQPNCLTRLSGPCGSASST
jgi:hypothetical protein